MKNTLLKKLEADGRDVLLTALSAFVGAFVVLPGNPVKDVLAAAGLAALRAAIGKLALMLGAVK